MSYHDCHNNLNLRNRIVLSINDEMNTVCKWEDGCKACQYKGFCDIVHNFISNLDKYIIELADRKEAK